MNMEVTKCLIKIDLSVLNTEVPCCRSWRFHCNHCGSYSVGESHVVVYNYMTLHVCM